MAQDILIVDDEADICMLTAGILSDEGYETRQASGSASAFTCIEQRKPELDAQDVKAQIETLLEQQGTGRLKPITIRKIEGVLTRSSAWHRIKDTGLSFVPSGNPTAACRRLLTTCAKEGLFIVEVGELERFCPSIGKHGPAWLGDVLSRDLKSDPELEAARKFSQSISEWANTTRTI